MCIVLPQGRLKIRPGAASRIATFGKLPASLDTVEVWASQGGGGYVRIRLAPGKSPDGASLWDFLGCVRALESVERCQSIRPRFQSYRRCAVAEHCLLQL